MSEKPYAVGTFSRPEDLLAALRRLRNDGFPVADVYSPYPLHGIEELLGWRRSRLGFVTFAAGVAGALGALALQFYTAAFDWPVNVGGKPDNSLLAFIPITFELTVLAGGLATAGAFLAVSRLFPGKRPQLPAAGVTDDRFAIVLDPRSPALAGLDLPGLLAEAGAEEIHERSLG